MQQRVASLAAAILANLALKVASLSRFLRAHVDVDPFALVLSAPEAAGKEPIPLCHSISVTDPESSNTAYL